jgi:rhamnosyltransferase
MIKASVIIPTKNAGELFIKVITQVLTQETPWDYEVVIIDSGSSDQTGNLITELQKKDPRIRFFEIKSETFGHGRTRNLGASYARGEFLVFITQDALPFNNRWLFELVTSCDSAPNIAGAFGKHLPYDTASSILKKELTDHFNYIESNENPLFITDPERFKVDEGYRQLLHFFSNNNSCIRKSIWKEIPFPDVNFAEDQAWADLMIRAGHAKAYASKAIVYHSHDYSNIEKLRRCYDESRALHSLFGYILIKSWQSMLRSILGMAITDTNFLVNHYKKPRFFIFISRLIARSCSILGLYLGSRIAYTSLIGQRLSLDNSLKKKKS